jgi:mannose-6-phosphate isomerase-like protein (cupin superfamily)
MRDPGDAEECTRFSRTAAGRCRESFRATGSRRGESYPVRPAHRPSGEELSEQARGGVRHLRLRRAIPPHGSLLRRPGGVRLHRGRGAFGFESLSFIITETQPSGGPPLHTHESEEAHILLEGEVEYVIGDQRFAARGPYIARVPKGVPHTFANRGPCSFNLLAVFPSNKLTYKELGPNPLVPGAPDASKASGH